MQTISPALLSLFPSVVELDLSDNPSVGRTTATSSSSIPDVFRGQIPDVRRLDLGNCSISAPSAPVRLAELLPVLDTLNLSSNSLTTLHDIAAVDDTAAVPPMSTRSAKGRLRVLDLTNNHLQVVDEEYGPGFFDQLDVLRLGIIIFNFKPPEAGMNDIKRSVQ